MLDNPPTQNDDDITLRGSPVEPARKRKIWTLRRKWKNTKRLRKIPWSNQESRRVQSRRQDRSWGGIRGRAIAFVNQENSKLEASLVSNMAVIHFSDGVWELEEGATRRGGAAVGGSMNTNVLSSEYSTKSALRAKRGETRRPKAKEKTDREIVKRSTEGQWRKHDEQYQRWKIFNRGGQNEVTNKPVERSKQPGSRPRDLSSQKLIERSKQPNSRSRNLRHYGDSASLDGDDTKKRHDGDSASLDGDDMMVPRRRRGRAAELGSLGLWGGKIATARQRRRVEEADRLEGMRAEA
nr:hypothetical protein Iba_chr13dCG8180 [Ipomoea batatas]